MDFLKITMSEFRVLLANRHPCLSKGIVEMISSRFDEIMLSDNENSLLACASRSSPGLAIVDISISQDGSLVWIQSLRKLCAGLKLIVIGTHDEASVRDAVLKAGADGYLLERAIASDLLLVIDDVLAERNCIGTMFECRKSFEKST